MRNNIQNIRRRESYIFFQNVKTMIEYSDSTSQILNYIYGFMNTHRMWHSSENAHKALESLRYVQKEVENGNTL
jgi:hypothetical protein